MSITSSEGSRTVAPLAGAWVEISKGQLGSHRRTTSLPSRERGLKSVNGGNTKIAEMSLPSRERGLKFDKLEQMDMETLSLPSRERGLKL